MALNNVPSRFAFRSSDDSVDGDTTVDETGIDIIPVDTSGGAVTVTLGSELQVNNNVVKIVDVAGSAGTNSITVDAGTSTINGSATGILDADNESIELVYLESTGQFHVTNRYGGGGLI